MNQPLLLLEPVVFVTVDATFPMLEFETFCPVCPGAVGDFCVLAVLGVAVELSGENVATANDFEIH